MKTGGIINHFCDLDAWKISNDFVLEIYRITNSFPQHEQFGLTSQIRRASVSITCNIAEGFGRYHYRDKIRFYYLARGSNTEVQNLLIICKHLNYISVNEFNKLKIIIFNSYKLINGLIRSTAKQC